MIRITQQDNAKAAKSYYSTSDYYSEGQEIIGRWGGKAAARLGLTGTVDKDSFERLCDNLDPSTGKRLTVRARTERRVGYDFTFSVPKSVSLLYAMSGDEGIMDAFRGAVGDTMRELEAETKTRIRTKGQDADRTTGNMVWAEFIHTTSRPVDGIPDPQLHAHCFVFNATWDDAERRWKAVQIGDIKRDSPYFQAAFRVRLADRLQDLGFAVARKRDDFEIAGIPPDVLKRYSRRTTLIEKVAAEKGITDARRKDGLGVETREQKTKELSWNQLKQEWRKRLSDGEWEKLKTVYRRPGKAARPERGEAAAVDHATSHSFVREAVVPERKLITEALKRGIGAVTVEGVTREVSKRPLIRSAIAGRDMVTTKEMLALESKVIDFARQGRGRFRPIGDPNRPCSRDWLNDDQKAAVSYVVGSWRDRVMIIRGVAGTGKTTLEQEIGEALAEAGRPVVAIAQSVKASREVLRQEAGFANADTLAMFLKDEKMREGARGGVILVDEASQIGTRDMHQLFSLAEDLNARVILVGDKRQHRSVSAGEPLKLLEEQAGVKVASVTKIMRQQGEYKQAAQDLSEGKTEEAFEQLDKLGWIRQVPDADRYQQLADAYLSATSERKRGGQPKSALVVSPTHAEGKRVNDAIRAGLKAKRQLGKDRIVQAWVPAHLTDAQKADATEYEPGDLIQFQQNATGFKKGARIILDDGVQAPTALASRFEVYRPVELALAAGDRIRVTAGGQTRDGKRFSNGSIFIVEGFTKRGDIIIGPGRVIDRNFGHLAHGYAVTSHASQGATVDKVFVAMSSESLPATDQRTAYVALTRGREQAQIFTDDRKALLKAISRLDDPVSATELSGQQNPAWRNGQGFGFGARRPDLQPGIVNAAIDERGIDHER